MKITRTLTSFTSTLFLLLFCVTANAQEPNDATKKPTDTLVIKQKYGLRLGADISKLVRSFLDDEYKGFEINGDYRLTKNWYIAGELGTEEKTTRNDFLSSTANGSYFKAGFDYNMYNNWVGMENMIYSGFRIGASTFSQQRNSYTVYSTDQFWTPQFTSTDTEKFSGLSSIWAELIMGFKAEVLSNLFLGIQAQLKFSISEDEPANFGNNYIPGFGKTYDGSNIGVGYGYTVSYLIPIFKKNK
ncbi:hypothetical protein ES676_10240 [Bizionia saleffrena]|uniref:DUF3575 domain-containing protein n=1 Tax=Bizionia saleffrena TaxID=291189 RepID=A0A8H2LGF4_9FLAO|nr:DUF6048 family protein [Bizionia saleffrena]TYB73125.1 hypothetical protein ES676_10240 [Bizionia saleffrena]